MRRLVFPLLTSLLGAALVVVLLWQTLQGQLVSQLKEALSFHLVDAVDEKLFSDGSGRATHVDAIQMIGQRINEQRASFIQTGPLALQRQCRVVLTSIDGVNVAGNPAPGAYSRTLFIPFVRNHLERTAVVELSCEPNYPLFYVLVLLLVVLFALIYLAGFRPLGAHQYRWLGDLLDYGYRPVVVRRLVAEFNDETLAFTQRQQRCFDSLHDPDTRNARAALRAAGNPVLRQLDDLGESWFRIGLRLYGNDFDRALALALAPDGMTINLRDATCSIRGIDIPVSKTPLFYLVWYARARGEGDGWITNPASNRPDKEQGKQLAAFMWRYKGHAKAIGDLEETGLKAKTLDQNRSKIKDEVGLVLGEELAAHYLFETDKKGATGRSRYRLVLPPEQITILE